MSNHALPAGPAFAGSPTPSKLKRFNKKHKFAAAAAIAGSALLLGSLPGNSLAMWMAQVTQSGGTITAGNMGLALPAGPSYFDTSPDKAPSSIDLATYRAVPGDQISVVQSQAVTMVGTNLKADWSVVIPQGGALAGALASPGSGVTGKVYFGAGTYDPATFNPANALASASLDGTGTTAVVHFNQPALNGGVAALNDGTLTDGTAKLFAVEVIDYAANSTDNTIQGAQAQLSAINYTLTQVR